MPDTASGESAFGGRMVENTAAPTKVNARLDAWAVPLCGSIRRAPRWWCRGGDLGQGKSTKSPRALRHGRPDRREFGQIRLAMKGASRKDNVSIDRPYFVLLN